MISGYYSANKLINKFSTRSELSIEEKKKSIITLIKLIIANNNNIRANYEANYLQIQIECKDNALNLLIKIMRKATY